MALTDVGIRKAKAGPKAYKMSDSSGLFLLVEPTGGKLWRMKYRIDGREKKLAIGRYPEIGLAEACRHPDRRSPDREQGQAGKRQTNLATGGLGVPLCGRNSAP